MRAYPLYVLGAVLVYGIVHSLLASMGVKALAGGLFGEWTRRYYRLVYNLVAAVSLLPVLILAARLPDTTLYYITSPWSLISFSLQALAGLALLAGLLQTGLWSFAGLRQVVAPDAPQSALTTGGLYRWVRHPLYSAGLALVWLSPHMTVNRLALFAGLTFYILLGALLEERKLVQEFGQAYLLYRERTPMLVPRFNPLRRFRLPQAQ
jgi:protein-S-isoprenylcysteine O-methyltransferase Ste14